MAQAYPENRRITDSLPHHYGPKTDRRIRAVMSHNGERVRCWLHASPPAAQRMAKCVSKADPPNGNRTLARSVSDELRHSAPPNNCATIELYTFKTALDLPAVQGCRRLTARIQA
jgi:hypothetical protein